MEFPYPRFCAARLAHLYLLRVWGDYSRQVHSPEGFFASVRHGNLGRRATMDIGIWMNVEALDSKLEHQDTANPEAAWNLSKWPRGFTDDAGAVNRLFVASGGHWVGYFVISPEMLYLPEDQETPYVLLFDTRTWTEMPRISAKRFRGFTYGVPREIAPGRWELIEEPPLQDEADGSGRSKAETSSRLRRADRRVSRKRKNPP